MHNLSFRLQYKMSITQTFKCITICSFHVLNSILQLWWTINTKFTVIGLKNLFKVNKRNQQWFLNFYHQFGRRRLLFKAISLWCCRFSFCDLGVCFVTDSQLPPVDIGNIWWYMLAIPYVVFDVGNCKSMISRPQNATDKISTF